VAACVLILAGCGTQRTPDHYTGSVETNFVKSCTAQSKTALSNPSKTCNCTYAEIKKSIKFSRFKEINSQLTEKPARLPADITNILNNCKDSSGGASSTATTTKPG
jgi:hypothetical protein